jgi:4-amino-4-deoxy-L-arabinose transferase-like glycosyltransferase
MSVLKKYKLIILILAIISLGIFLRVWNFSDWLHFEIDQTFDTIIVSQAVEKGIGELPLLGPTAGGGRSLRLGPAFYYMEYLSAMVFGDNPAGHAMLVLTVSILALPLFYLFSRIYFSRKISLMILFLFCVSLYNVLYSRFSWSPNVLPLFTLLLFYSMLRSVSDGEKRKSVWFLFSIAVTTILTQIHFNSFFVIPPIVFLFFLIKRPNFRWKIWISALSIVIILYSPVIAHEIRTKGQDISYFAGKFEKRTTSIQGALTENIFKNIQYNAFEYFLIISGNDQINEKQPKGYALGLSDYPQTLDLFLRIAGLIYFGLAIFLLIKNLLQKKSGDHKNFLILVFLWFIFSFLYFYSIVRGYRIYPRFFLLVSPLAFIFLGLILDSLKPQKNKRRFILAALLVLALVSFNLYQISRYFNQLANAGIESVSVKTEDIFPNFFRVPLERQMAVIDYIESIYKKNGYPVYIQSIPEFEPVFWYHLKKRNIEFYGDLQTDIIYKKANYFLINKSPLREYRAQFFNVADEKKLGILEVYYLTPKPEKINAEIQMEKNKMEQTELIEENLTWKKSFWNNK